LQALFTGISPALERAADLNRKGPLMVLACWQTPAAIRHAGTKRSFQFEFGVSLVDSRAGR
jgi:hypothetical protein